MRVLHLSTFDVRGGAARGAYWLHRALRERGIDSRMLVSRKYADDPTVVEPHGRLAGAIRAYLDALPLRGYRKTNESFWTVGWVPSRIDRAIAALRPDIIHLHWTGGGFLSVDALRKLPYPMVWTLRDMWAFTGGCHYSAGCERYKVACGRCPQLSSPDVYDLSRRLWLRKHLAWQGADLWLVPISHWLADCTRRSGLFHDRPIEVIPNGVDTARFTPSPPREAKASWGLSPERRHILFGAINAIDDTRKGFAQFRDAARALSMRGWGERAEIVVFGSNAAPPDFPDLGIPVRFAGRVDDDRALARLYAAADVMVVPSLQEAFGKTLVEAMACATPVVAFDHGGPVDIVDHGKTGFLAEPHRPEALADGIAWCIEDEGRTTRLGRGARRRVERDFDIEVVAERYHQLYDRALARMQ